MNDIYKTKNFIPMLLSEQNKAFNDINYIFEIKFDGIRALIFVEPNKIIIKNRRGNILNETFPELLNIKKNIKHKCIFDGEIIIMDNGKPSFNKLQSRALLKDIKRINYLKEINPAIFVCFDILYDNKDITNFSLLERKKILENYSDTDNFIKTKYIFESGKKLLKETSKLQLEGIVAKEINSKYYINKRSKEWIKIKNFLEEDFYIGGYQLNKEKGMASLVLGRKESDKLIHVGNVTIGKKNPAFLIIKNLKKSKSYFYNLNDNKVIFIKPTYKCSVLFIEKTTSGSLRQPIFKELKY